MPERKFQTKNICHGGDYNPEQWLDRPDILKEDIVYMKESGCNTVSLGMFSWSTLEPEEGKFQFDWLEERINTLFENGISVFLSTPSGARPKWLADKYSEVLRVDANRQRDLFGKRHNHCYTSPIYREKVWIINTELAKRFANHPAVKLWHISNEYGGECHCPLCQNAFREFLCKKYKTIEALNKAWYTVFWSHSYQSFQQIESPSPRGEDGIHALTLDWKRFVTEQTLNFYKMEVESVHAWNPSIPTTTNMMYYYEGLNYFKFKDAVDVVSWDSYPLWHKKDDYAIGIDVSMFHDIMKSVKKKPFLLMESTPSVTNWQGISKLKKPGMHELSSLQAVAHGADAVMYFQWRQSRGAFEKFHGAVIDHLGSSNTRIFKDVSKLGKLLSDFKDIAGSECRAKAAVIYDWENAWAIAEEKGPRNQGMYYKETVLKSYEALKHLGFQVDVIDMECSLDGYELVSAPMLYMFRAGMEEKLEQFTKNGGILITTYWSGVVNENDCCNLGDTPYKLSHVLGLYRSEIDALYDEEENSLVPADNNVLFLDKQYICKNLCELSEVETAEVICTYGTDFYKNSPCCTRHKYGSGWAYYIGTDAETPFYHDFYEKIIKSHGLKPDVEFAIPENVIVNVRKKDDRKFIFVQNFSSDKQEVELPKELEKHLVYGTFGSSIKEYGTLVFDI